MRDLRLFCTFCFLDVVYILFGKTEFQSNKSNIPSKQTASFDGECGMKLLKTWIEGLDEMLGGGLPEKSVILMMGEPGSGYDTFAQQILYQNALQGGKIAYFSTSRDFDALKDDFETFGWDATSMQKTDSW